MPYSCQLCFLADAGLQVHRAGVQAGSEGHSGLVGPCGKTQQLSSLQTLVCMLFHASYCVKVTQ